jgi:pSer/pThr/pTyr-binding forkhead associated (FHA) protein
MGLMLGAGVGIASLSSRNILKGAAGGWVGGFVGGLLFDPLNEITGGGLLSRLVGTCAVGLAIGLFIGLVQELTKDAWIVVEGGRLKGRQFRLERPLVTLGRAEESAIGLFGDPQVQPRHAEITRDGGAWKIRNLAVRSGTRINGAIVETAALNENDTISIGNYLLRFHSRSVRTAEKHRPTSPASTHFQSPQAPGQPAIPCIIDASGTRYELNRNRPTNVGRALDNDVIVAHPSVSRHHAQFVAANGTVEMRDLGSKNGTWVAGRRVNEVKVADGYTLRFGDAPFTFRG